jgi:hypothetical protein
VAMAELATVKVADATLPLWRPLEDIPEPRSG